MKTFELSAESREKIGKKAAKALRAEGKVPCVLYGKGENVHFVVEDKQFTGLVYTPNVYIVDLTVDGKKETAIMKDIQFQPVTDEILHVDFVRVNAEDPIVIEVPVKTTGLAKGVKAGGKLHIANRKLKVKSAMEFLPDDLTIDVSNLGLGKSIKVEDLSFEDVELVNSPKTVVVQVNLTRAARAAEAGSAGDDDNEEGGSEEENSSEE